MAAKLGAILFVLFTLFAPVASAQPYELEWDPVIDGIVTGVSGFGWLSAETFLKEPLSPKNCRWCEPPGFDLKIRESLQFENQSAPKIVSDVNIGVSAVVAYGGLAALGALANRGDDFFLNALLLTEAVSVTMLFTNIIKWTVARQRPPTSAGAFAEGSSEDNLSFFSGHTTFTTVFGTAAGTLALLRGYRYSGWLLGIGIGLGLATAITRVGADAHYFSDVLTGFLVGGGLGFAIPYLFHGRKSADARATVATQLLPQTNGFTLSLRF